MAALVRRPTRPSLVLAAVCALHGVSSIIMVGLHHGFGWDETVYLSQINRFVPPGIWSAPRSRGLTLLVAPATLLTFSTAATRLWLALLTSVLLYVGFRPWLRLIPAYAVALAALLLSSLWMTIFYGAEAMPNLFVACFAVPAVALALLYLREPERWSRLLWLALCLAAIALIRPSDAVYAAVPIGLVVLLARGYAWRSRLVVLGTLAVGVIAGAAEWVIEAYVSFGGPMQRYHAALGEQGGSGLRFSLGNNARALAGPILCREGCHANAPWWAVAWWVGLAVLTVAGLLLARRRERLPVVAAVVAGLFCAAQYIFGVWYAAPRFLLPAYALLFVAAAVGLVELVRRAPAGAARAVVVGVIVLLVGAQLVTQAVILRTKVLPPNNHGLKVWAAMSYALKREVVGHSSCAVAGPSTPPMAYGARCRSVSTTQMRNGDVGNATVRVFYSRARVDRAGTWLQSWHEMQVQLPGRYGHAYAYLPPGVAATPLTTTRTTG